MTTAPAYDNSVLIGCARVATRAQEHWAQLDALAATHCPEIVVEIRFAGHQAGLRVIRWPGRPRG